MDREPIIDTTAKELDLVEFHRIVHPLYIVTGDQIKRELVGSIASTTRISSNLHGTEVHFSTHEGDGIVADGADCPIKVWYINPPDEPAF